MAIYEYNATMTIKAENGDKYIVYPKTFASEVECENGKNLEENLLEAKNPLKKVTGSGNISVTVEDNTEYRYTDVTNLSITCPGGEFECFIRASFSSGISFSVTNGNPCHSNYDLAGDTGGGDVDYSGTVLEIHIKDGWYTLIVDDLGTYMGK